MRIFLQVSIYLLLIGGAYSLYVALKVGLGIPVLGALVMITGALIGTLGLIADQISQIRISAIDPPPSSEIVEN